VGKIPISNWAPRNKPGGAISNIINRRLEPGAPTTIRKEEPPSIWGEEIVKKEKRKRGKRDLPDFPELIDTLPPIIDDTTPATNGNGDNGNGDNGGNGNGDTGDTGKIPLNQFSDAWTSNGKKEFQAEDFLSSSGGGGGYQAGAGGDWQPEAQEIPYKLLIYGMLIIVGTYLLIGKKK